MAPLSGHRLSNNFIIIFCHLPFPGRRDTCSKKSRNKYTPRQKNAFTLQNMKAKRCLSAVPSFLLDKFLPLFHLQTYASPRLYFEKEHIS